MSESKERVPKIANYYKNYLTFFCNPVFRDFNLNSIIQVYSDNKAELYYNKTYSNKPKKESKKNQGSFVFSSVVRDDINNQVLTEVSEDRRNNDTSIFNDEFFIYRPDKKRIVDDHEASFFLNYSKNNSHIKSGLLTMQSREEDILNIVSNLNKPLNERIIDKIQKSSTKKQSTYNFSTTDKSKGEDMSNYANNLIKKNNNINDNKNELLQKAKESNPQNPYLFKESRKIDNFQMINCAAPISNLNYISDKEKENLLNNKKPSELFNVSNVPNSSKSKNIIKTSDQGNMNKSPTPVTVKNSKIPLGVGVGSSIKIDTGVIPSSTNTATNNIISATTSSNKINTANSNNTNKIIDYKPIKYESKPASTTKFANLLYSSESNLKNYSSTQRSNSNSQSATIAPAKTHHKNMRSMDINKYNVDLETPTNNLDVKYFEMTSTTNKVTEEKQTPTMSLNFNKGLRTRQLSSGHNYDNLLLTKGRQDKSIGKNNSKTGVNKEVDGYLSEVNKLKKLNSDNNFISSSTSNTKKISNVNNFSENSHRMMSSFTVKAASNSQVKINFNTNQRITSSRVGNTEQESKGKMLNNYFQAETKGSVSTKNYSKPKDNNLITDRNSSAKKTAINRKMKSGEFFSNNYLTTNNTNVNTFLQKISSTRNIGFNDSKTKKNQFSPHKSSTKKI